MYDIIVKNDDSIVCSTCKRENIPFHEVNDIELSAINKCIEINSEILDNALIKSSTLTHFFREVNDSFSIQQPLGLKDEDSDQLIIDCKYLDLDKFTPSTSKKKPISLSYKYRITRETH